MPAWLQSIHDFLFVVELLVVLFVVLAAAVSLLQERRQRVEDRVSVVHEHSAWTVREEEVEEETKGEGPPTSPVTGRVLN